MKRFLILALIAFSFAGALRAERSMPRKDYVTRIESCEAIIREFQASADYQIPQAVLQNAQAIVITNQFKAGFLFGVKDGYGVIMVRRPDGSWSIPAMLSAGEASFGLQIGANSVETVYILNDVDIARRLYKGRFNIGVDAAAIAGPRVAETTKINREILAAPILVYTKKTGLFAGATVKTGWIAANNVGNRAFYETRYGLPEILFGDWVALQPEAEPLHQYIAQITQ
ncbi:lipid-binding SYLF domain-containing protein [Actomonas aquatica]|uniref:Lipid-binding SYLF domain-containing protein n=1 Tax=Actomonas aquatica TaxID=2866162 RepID=A0ABZ1C4H9_9BACT|nr:lipid-binding SYLF domain-containing protein [Opitutus sp. WL0086]WRQ86391.1 lipid-binding SYLF domain-containing protein [Opitutus sp. WL0086]